MVAILWALLVVVFSPVIFSGGTFSASWTAVGVNGGDAPPSDIAIPPDNFRLDRGASSWQFEPWAEVTSRALHDGDVPLWNRYAGIGMPHAANFQSSALDPLLAAVNYHPTPLVWDATFLLIFLLGAAVAYAYLRVHGLGPIASLGGATVFVLGGHFLLYSNNQFFRVYSYLPAMFLAVDLTVRGRRRWAPIALGATVAGAFLAGMPEAFVCVAIGLGLYCAWFLAFPPEGTARKSVFFRLAGGAVLAGLLSAPLLLPAMEYVPRAFTSHEPGSKVGETHDPGRILLHWTAPRIIGEPMKNLQGTGWSGTRDWIGAAAFIAVLAALASPKVFARKAGWFFLVLAVGLLAKIYGVGVLDWVGKAPGFERVNFPPFAAPVVAFAGSVLAAIGIEAIDRRSVRKPLFAGLLALAGLGLLRLYHANDAFLAAAPPGHQRMEVGRAALAGAVVVVAVVLPWRRIGRLLAVGAVVAELLSLTPGAVYQERIDPYIRPQWLQTVLAKAGPGDRVYGADAKLFPNYAGAFGLQDIRMNDALYPKRFVSYVKQFIQPRFHDRFVGGPYGQPFEERPPELDDNPMFDVLGVRYVITGGLDPGDRIIKRLFETRPANAGVRPAMFDINGDRRAVLFLHSGNDAELAVPDGTDSFSFSYGLDPAAFADPTGDGVDVAVDARVGATTTTVWTASMVPRTDPVKPEWRNTVIPLPARSTAVRVWVSARANPATDWFGVGDLAFTSRGGSGDATARQYRRIVSEGSTSVYQNQRSAPRAFVVHDVIRAADEKRAVAALETRSERLPSGAFHVTTFNPTEQAVVEVGAAAGPAFPPCTSTRPASLRSADADEVVVRVPPGCPGLLVLTELFYPGWKAEVNGRPARIYATDIAFRGVVVPVDGATVRFRYEPRSFKLGAGMAAAGMLGSVAFLLLPYLPRRRRS